MKRNQVVPAIVAVAFVLFPLVVRSPYYRHLVILALMWVVIGGSWNLLAGYTGQVSFGHAVFFGVGAYTAGIFANTLEISAWWGMVFGGFTAGLIGLLIGWICFRLRGPYFALATIAAGEIFRLIATNWESLTEGMVGILIIQSFRSKLPYYYIALALAAASILVFNLVMKSKLGFYFVSIREDQDAAESLGINATLYKNISLLISSFFTGMAGAFYMNYMAFIDPEVVFSLHYISIMAILVGIIGGVATIWGPAVGAFIMIGVQETSRLGLRTSGDFCDPLHGQRCGGRLAQDQTALCQEPMNVEVRAVSFFEVKEISKKFGGLMAVGGVSFEVEQGAIFGLIGPNGSGKTTIFNLINQYFPLTGGDIFFKGKSLKGMKTYKICHLGIGRTFQVVKPLKRMSVLENVTASAFCRVNSFKEAQKLAMETLEFCNLLHEKDKSAASLPIAGRKRLEITRALATKPELLLLDETAAGLNPGELDEAIDLIKAMRDRGVTIIIVEHIMKVIMTISDRIHAINYGQTIAEGSPEEVANNKEVIEAYLGEE
jgi:branched-chain amino acid transport system permease protein